MSNSSHYDIIGRWMAKAIKIKGKSSKLINRSTLNAVLIAALMGLFVGNEQHERFDMLDTSRKRIHMFTSWHLPLPHIEKLHSLLINLIPPVVKTIAGLARIAKQQTQIQSGGSMITPPEPHNGIVTSEHLQSMALLEKSLRQL